MKLLRLHGTMALSIAGALALYGCSSDDGEGGANPPNNNNTSDVPEAGVIVDTGPTNNNMDVPDAGPFRLDLGFRPDARPRDTGVPPCPDGTEGCACISSLTPEGTSFEQDDCDNGLLCVPWDLISGDPDIVGAIQSCVRPCSEDSDCGTNVDGSRRRCVESGFLDTTGAPRICVDRIAESDQFCGFSRLDTSRVTDVDVQTGREMVGCAAETSCLQRFFGDVHPDEGICLNLCDTDADCANTPQTPTCNPAVFTTTATTGDNTIGFCSEGKKGVGSFCGAADETKVGLTTRCDTSDDAVPNTICLPGDLVGLDFGTNSSFLPDGTGICTTLCNDDLPCEGVDPALGRTRCSDFYLATQDMTQFGVCSSGCTAFPDNCAGPGELGAGRFCSGEAAFNGQFCMDIIPPTLAPGELNPQGQVNAGAGDNCLVDDATTVLSCPQGGRCFAINAAATQGRCFYGCARGPNPDPSVCINLLGVRTAACSPALGDPSAGLCAPN